VFSTVNVSYLAAGDLDGDGDLDLVASSWDASSNKLLSLRNVGGLSFVVRSQSAGLAYGKVSLVDLDFDGDLDAVESDYYGWKPSLFYNSGTGILSESKSLSCMPDVGTMAAGAGDFDNNGSVDIAVLDFANERLRFVTSTDNYTTPFEMGTTTTNNMPSAPSTGDFNGDDVPDLIVVHFDNSVTVHLSNP
jgi:hypothetical protein